MAATLVLAAGCGAGGQGAAELRDAPDPSDSTSAKGRLLDRGCEHPAEVDEPWAGASLSRLKQESDLVVRGTVINVVDGFVPKQDRGVQGAGDLESAILTVRPDDVVKGADQTFEITMLTGSNGCNDVVAGQAIPDLGDEALFFAVEVPDYPDVDYVPVSTSGVIVFDDQGRVTNSKGDQAAVIEARRLANAEAVMAAARG